MTDTQAYKEYFIGVCIVSAFIVMGMLMSARVDRVTEMAEATEDCRCEYKTLEDGTQIGGCLCYTNPEAFEEEIERSK